VQALLFIMILGLVAIIAKRRKNKYSINLLQTPFLLTFGYLEDLGDDEIALAPQSDDGFQPKSVPGFYL